MCVLFFILFLNSELKEKLGKKKKKKENIKGNDIVVPLPKFISQSL